MYLFYLCTETGPDNEFEEYIENVLKQTHDIDIDFSPYDDNF